MVDCNLADNRNCTMNMEKTQILGAPETLPIEFINKGRRSIARAVAIISGPAPVLQFLDRPDIWNH